MYLPAKTRSRNRDQVSDTASQPAPIGGWNARDSLAMMKVEDAVQLDNFFCLPSEVQVRYGYSNWATGLGSQVESLMDWQSGSARQIFAAAGTAFYDVTSTGAVGAAVQSGLTNARWQSTVYELAGTTWLISVNGVDKPRYWDGAAWVAVDNASVPAITGVTTTTLVGVTVHQKRVWFVQSATLTAYYLPVNAVGGAATAFNFGPLFSRGGYLMALSTWSIDAGDGSDDLLVAITSEGEIAIYRGTDPATAATWALIGVFYVGTPMGRRCAMKYGGDCLIITKDGLLPLSKGLASVKINTKQNLTDKIQSAISTATTAYGSNFGWECALYPSINMLLMNVPVTTGSQEQYVMNTITGAWSRFTGWAANCWVLSNDELYFGGNGVVAKAWQAHQDNDSDIVADVQQSFSYFSLRGQLKHWNLARPILRSDGTAGILIGMNVDYRNDDPSGTITLSSVPGSVFGSAVFGTATFGGGALTVTAEWQGIKALGTAGGLRMRVSTRLADVRWAATDFNMIRGGVVG